MSNGLGSSVVQQKTAELTDFATLLDNLPDAAWIADAEGWIFWYNRYWYTYTGTTPDEMAGWGWQSVHDPDQLPAVLDRWKHSILTGEPFEMEFPLKGADGLFRPFLTRVRPVQDAAGTLTHWVGSNIDISAQRQAEKDRQLIMSELNHRVKNLFAMTAGMVTMTARRSKTVAEMATSLTGRIAALSRAHDLIRSAVLGGFDDDEDAALADLIMAVVAPHVPDERDQIQLNGPDLMLGPIASTSLALVLHEMATNAVKYGALSSEKGCIEIAWRLELGQLILHWTENGGPTIMIPPTHRGFGTQLTRTSIEGQLGGHMSHDWRPSGVSILLTIKEDNIRL